jgi:rod shape determining protein RodA
VVRPVIDRELTLGDRFKRADWTLLGLGLLLSVIGCVVVHLASVGQRADYGWLQTRWTVIGLAACLLVLAVPYRRIVDLRHLLYGGGVLLLVLVLFVGRGKTAGRWIELAGFRLQPSEVMKLFLVIALAGALRYEQGFERERRIRVPVLLTLVPVLLVMKQPDLGTGLLFVPLLVAVLYAAGVRGRPLLLFLGLGLAGLLVLWFVPGLLQGYQRTRFEAFLRQGSEDPVLLSGHGHQLHESKTVVGTGPVFGNGTGEDTEEAIRLLPERHSDFAFPVFANAFGLAGVTVLMVLYLLFLGLLLRTSLRVREPSGRLLAVGATALFAVQAVVNMAMTVGLLPIVGMPLPFISYGGSSLLTSFLALGLVLNVGAESPVEFGRSDFD